MPTPDRRAAADRAGRGAGARPHDRARRRELRVKESEPPRDRRRAAARDRRATSTRHRRRLGDPRRARAPPRRPRRRRTATTASACSARSPGSSREQRRARRRRVRDRRLVPRLPRLLRLERLAVRPMVIAIDGPAGAGKSTVAQPPGASGSATATWTPGAMYRAVTLARAARRAPTRRRPPRSAAPGARHDGRPAPAQPEVERRVSARGRHRRRRPRGAARGAARVPREGDAVAEGRDIGEVVWPRGRAQDLARRRARGARAPARARAGRRGGRGALAERDQRDAAQTIAPPDAVVHRQHASSSRTTVVDRIVALARGARGVSDGPRRRLTARPPERLWGFCAPAASSGRSRGSSACASTARNACRARARP